MPAEMPMRKCYKTTKPRSIDPSHISEDPSHWLFSHKQNVQR